MSRVLLVTNIFPPQIGGPATFIDRLGHALAEAGYRVTVVCSSFAPTEPSDRQRPFRVRRILVRNRVLYELDARFVLLQEMARHSVILVNGLEQQAYEVARRLGRRYILKVVGDTVWETARNVGATTLGIDEYQAVVPEEAGLRRLKERRDRFVRRAQRVITPSEYLRRMVTGWGVDPAVVQVVPNGVTLAEYEHGEPTRRADGPLEVLFVGRLTNWKGVETLLLAMSNMSGVRASVVGDGPEWPHLVELARQLQLEGTVEFTGRLDPAEVRQRLARAHVLVLTSLYEGLSHTLLEALATGVPCIASGCGGNAETIRDGETGLLISPQDVSALREALRTMEQDEALRYRLAVQARQASHQFDFALTVQQTMAVVLGTA